MKDRDKRFNEEFRKTAHGIEYLFFPFILLINLICVLDVESSFLPALLVFIVLSIFMGIGLGKREKQRRESSENFWRFNRFYIAISVPIFLLALSVFPIELKNLFEIGLIVVVNSTLVHAVVSIRERNKLAKESGSS